MNHFRQNSYIKYLFVGLVVIIAAASASHARALQMVEDGSGSGTGYGGVPRNDLPPEQQPAIPEVDIDVSYVTNGSSVRSPRQTNTQLTKTLWYGWNRWLSGSYVYPQSNVAVSGYVAGLNDPNITIGYDIGVYDADNPAQLIDENATVQTGDRIILKFGDYTSDNIFWFGTGYSMDSPYGEWRTGASAPAVSCAAKDLVAKYEYKDGGVEIMQFDVYIPFVVSPQSRDLSNLTGLSCDPIVRNDPYGTAQATCTVTATSGTITPTFDFGNSSGKFYYRYYDYRDMGASYGGPGCYGNNIPMTDSFGISNGPAYNNNTSVGAGYTFPVVARSFPYPLVIAPLTNDPPANPTITCPASANVGSNISVTLRATDPDNDQVRYGADWPTEANPNNTGSPSQNSGWTALVNSNTSQTLTKSGGFSAPGSYRIYGIAQDEHGADSSYVSCVVPVSCAAGTVWNGSSCVVAAYSCTGTNPANANMCTNDDQGLSADTPKTAVGACTSPVKCEFTCNMTSSLVGGVCVPNTCQGSIPANGTAWSAGESNPPIAGGRSWTYSGTDSVQKCEFRCAAGFSWSGSACTPDAVPSLTLSTNPTGASADPVSHTASTNLTWTGTNFSSNDCAVGQATNAGGPWTPLTAANQPSSGSRTQSQAEGTTRYYRVACVTGPVTSNTVSFTVTAPATPDLTSNIDPTVNGTLTQGQSVTFNGQVRNSGSVPVTASFTDEFSYRWGTSGGWSVISPLSSKTYSVGSPFAAGGTSNDTSGSFTLGNNGTLQVQHCIDSQLQIAEGDETNNCRVTTFTVNPGTPFTISASPNPIQVCAPDTYGTTTITYTSPVNATVWVGASAFANLGAGTHSADTGDWVNNGSVFTLREGSGASQGVERANVTVNTTTAGCPSTDDLTSDIDPLLQSGSLTQGTNVTFRGQVRNTGSATISGFSDNFTYRWGTSGLWTQFGSHISKSPLTAGNASAEVSASFGLSNSGTLQIQHCVDSLGQINESDESNNCRTSSFTVGSPSYSCTGTIPANATICSSDNTGLTSDTPRTAVNACSVPGGSVPKCEYRCSAGYTAVANRCISGTISASPSQVVSGGTSVVSWNVSGSTSGLTCDVAGGSDSWTGTSGSQTTSPLSSATTYVLSCNGVAIAQTTVSLSAPPTLTGDPRIVDLGGSATLDYNLNGNTSCTLTGGGFNQVLSSQIGTIATGPILGTTTYTITCGGVSASVTIEVREEGHET